MLEIIKAIIEPVAKSISVDNLLEARKKKKAHEIGTELFLLYASLNDILVVGRRIVEELNSAETWMSGKVKEGKPDECCFTELEFLLDQQSLNILKLVASVKRLGLELQVIAPDSYLRLSPLLHGKFNAVSWLLDSISGSRGQPRRLVSIEAEKVLGLLKKGEAYAANEVGDELRTRVHDVVLAMSHGEPEELEDLIVYEPIEDVGSMPAKQYTIIRAYLKGRKPAAVLDEIESVLRALREAIEKNFSLRDILLNVGDRRSTLGDPSVGF